MHLHKGCHSLTVNAPISLLPSKFPAFRHSAFALNALDKSCSWTFSVYLFHFIPFLKNQPNLRLNHFSILLRFFIYYVVAVIKRKPCSSQPNFPISNGGNITFAPYPVGYWCVIYNYCSVFSHTFNESKGRVRMN